MNAVHGRREQVGTANAVVLQIISANRLRTGASERANVELRGEAKQR